MLKNEIFPTTNNCPRSVSKTKTGKVENISNWKFAETKVSNE